MMENNAPAAAEENQEAAETKVRRGKKNKPKKPLWREILEWVVTLAAAVAIALVIRTFIFEPVRVDGHSMDNTLANGEVMFVTKPEYLFGDPERFDVVICHYPGRGSTNFVKRVVGLPGERLAIHDDVIYIDGKAQPQPENAQWQYVAALSRPLTDEQIKEYDINQSDIQSPNGVNAEVMEYLRASLPGSRPTDAIVVIPLTNKMLRELKASGQITPSTSSPKSPPPTGRQPNTAVQTASSSPKRV